MSPNSGVVRYRSPVSGSMQRIVDPFGASLHTWMAAAKVPPAEVPTKIPSSRARRLLHCIASGAATVITRLGGAASPPRRGGGRGDHDLRPRSLLPRPAPPPLRGPASTEAGNPEVE